MTLRCPFCDAPEDDRVSGIDEFGEAVILLMFDCPFSLKISQKLILENDDLLQKYLDDWQQKNGVAWLDSIGPILKNRELRNMDRKAKRSLAA